MGGSRHRDEVSKLFDQEADISDYKRMVGAWMKALLEAEGKTPGAMVLDSLKHPVGRMTWDRWVDSMVAEVDKAEAAAAAEERAEAEAPPGAGEAAAAAL